MRQVFNSYAMSSQAGFQSSYEIKVELLAHAFDLAVDDSPDDRQMEFIELQADMDTNSAYSENSLVEFCKSYVCGKS